MLTFQQVQNARPREKACKLGDGQGLYLYVTPKGTRSWRFKYRYGRKEKRLTFGLFPEVTIAEARQCRDGARLELRRGKDPAVEIERKKRVDILAAGETFEILARQWLTDHEPHWSEANARRVRNRVEKDILSKLGSLPVRDITSDQILRQLRKIEARGSIETAKRVKGYVLAILKRARAERLISSDIIVDIECLADALKPNPPASRRPALTTLPELLAFQKAVDRSSADLLTKLASRLMALTLVRVSTLRLATWEEFDGIDWSDPESPAQKPIWRIPAGHMKLEQVDKGELGFGHDIPLCSQAVEVLRAIRQLTGRFDYAFPKATSWREPMTDSTLSGLYKRLEDGRYKGRMVPHGWRSAFSTLMNERAALLDQHGDRLVIDMALAHVPKGLSSSEWAYNRARYYKPRAALHEAWGGMITSGLCSPADLLAAYRGEGRGYGGARAVR